MEAVKATKIGEFYPLIAVMVSWMDFHMVAK